MLDTLLDIEKEKKRRELAMEHHPKIIAQKKRKEAATSCFWTYCVHMDSEYFDESKRPHLKSIATQLQKVESGNIKKLRISAPPRSGKSYIVSHFCAWRLGKHPEGSIMRNSYGDKLAKRFSYDVREIIKSSAYLEIFPHIKLKSDKHAVSDWSLESSKQIAYFCGGVGGPITGMGADLLAVLDDPIKNIEDALSELILDKTWEFYTGVHKARMEKDCPEIQIATRWSRKDPIGRLITKEGAEWTEIEIPALDENGETFCKEVKSTEEYIKLRNLLDPFIWEAEFMQHPIEKHGLLFPSEDLNYFTMDEVKKYYEQSGDQWDSIIGYTDTADEGTDFLSSLVAPTFGENIYITDVVFTQDPVETTEASVAQMIIDTKCDDMTIESNAAGKSFARNIDSLIEGKSRCTITRILNTKNKETRILMKSGQIKKYIYFRSDYAAGSDYDKFMRYLTSYVKTGKNKHDDAADSVTGLAESAFKTTTFEFGG